MKTIIKTFVLCGIIRAEMPLRLTALGNIFKTPEPISMFLAQLNAVM